MKNIIIVTTLLIVVGTVSVFILSNKDKTQTDPKELSKNSELDQETVSDKPFDNTSNPPLNGELDEYEELAFPNNTLDTSDWKTYRNEEFGFEVMYPREWKTRTLNKGDMLGIIDEDNSGVEFTQNASHVGLRIFFSTEPFSIVRDRKIEWSNDGNASYALIRVNEVNGIKTIQTKESVFGQIDYSFGDEDKTITFNNIRDEQQLFFEQMLLSFKLIK